MDVRALQYDIAWEAKERNFAAIEAWCAQAPPPAGALLVLPEMYATGFSMQVAAIAEDESCPAERFLAALATRYQVTAIGGVVRRDADGKGRNQALVIGPDGTELARYTKLHPFCLGSEHQHFRRGEGLVLFPWQGFTVAPLVCYDLRFPEAFRCAVVRGATLFVVIANWPAAREEHWLTLARARAIENLAYVVTVNRVGRDPHLGYSGRSQVINPRGEIVADAGAEAGWLAAALDAELVRNCRHGFPALNDLRPEFLGAACRA